MPVDAKRLRPVAKKNLVSGIGVTIEAVVSGDNATLLVIYDAQPTYEDRNEVSRMVACVMRELDVAGDVTITQRRPAPQT